MSFLLKGHTHNELDKLYGIIKAAIERYGALTLPELFKVISESFPRGEVRVVNFVSAQHYLHVVNEK